MESILGSSRNRTGYSCLTIVAQEPEGVTMCSSPWNTERNLAAIFRASFRLPELKAGCPQHVWERGTRTSTPNRSRTATVAKQTFGKKVSARQVENRETRIGGFRVIHQVYPTAIRSASGIPRGSVDSPVSGRTERSKVAHALY